ncbi:hypothetical protein [Mariniluteicoccus flavus]
MTETHATTNAAATRPGFLAAWARHPLTILTGVLALVYGIGFAIGWDDTMGWWAPVGAAIVGLVFAASLVAAALRTRTR